VLAKGEQAEGPMLPNTALRGKSRGWPPGDTSGLYVSMVPSPSSITSQHWRVPLAWILPHESLCGAKGTQPAFHCHGLLKTE